MTKKKLTPKELLRKYGFESPPGPSVEPKFIVCGGWIRSQHDNDEHRVSAAMLCGLYRLKKRERAICTGGLEGLQRMKTIYPKAIILGPRYDGKYHIRRQRKIRHDRNS